MILLLNSGGSQLVFKALKLARLVKKAAVSSAHTGGGFYSLVILVLLMWIPCQGYL